MEKVDEFIEFCGNRILADSIAFVFLGCMVDFSNQPPLEEKRIRKMYDRILNDELYRMCFDRYRECMRKYEGMREGVSVNLLEKNLHYLENGMLNA